MPFDRNEILTLRQVRLLDTRAKMYSKSSLNRCYTGIDRREACFASYNTIAYAPPNYPECLLKVSGTCTVREAKFAPISICHPNLSPGTRYSAHPHFPQQFKRCCDGSREKGPRRLETLLSVIACFYVLASGHWIAVSPNPNIDGLRMGHACINHKFAGLYCQIAFVRSPKFNFAPRTLLES